MKKQQHAEPAPSTFECAPPGWALKALREKRGLSRLELAEFAGLDCALVAACEDGIKTMRPTTWRYCALVLKVTPADVAALLKADAEK